MTIRLSPRNYADNRHEVFACARGEMCKIMKIDDMQTGKTLYFICADITQGGWTVPGGRKFHVHEIDETCRRTGLGTFYLIRSTETSDGGCILEFTDDLNPDLP